MTKDDEEQWDKMARVVHPKVLHLGRGEKGWKYMLER